MSDLASPPTDEPFNYVNDESIEIAWAIDAAERGNSHMNALMDSPDTTQLRLSELQGEIVAKFRESFPDMRVGKISEIDLKGANKESWRRFCELFNETVEDYNLATILRMDASGIYDDANALVVPKIIFLAIEGARNVEGINEKWKQKFSEEHRNAHASGDINVL